MSGKTPDFVTVIDSREQAPFAFRGVTGERGQELEVERSVLSAAIRRNMEGKRSTRLRHLLAWGGI